MAQDERLEAYLKSLKASQDPIHHTPIDMGINEFKRRVKSLGFNKKTTQRLIQAYKKRSWMEYQGIARNRGTFPTHREYGSKIEIYQDTNEESIKVYAY